MTQRITDQNGFFEIKANPLSRVGVFPYSGAQLGLEGDDARRIFQVYRPAEELSDPATLASFKLTPLVDDHTVVGPTALTLDPDNAMAAEEKGVHGVVGEDVFFKDGWLYGNIKIFSSALKRLIDAGKKQLSMGYACMYEMTAGVFEGQPYDAIQRGIRGNHVALVNEGRMGPAVAVLDHLCFTFDAKEAVMADENKTPDSGQKDMTVGELAAVVQSIVPQIAKIQEMMGKLTAAPAAQKAEEIVEEEDSADPAPSTQAPAAMDAALKTIAALEQRIKAIENADPAKAALVSLDQREQLIERVKPFIGVFDAKEKTTVEVARYALDKLELKNVPAGQEVFALDMWLTGRAVPETGGVSIAMDKSLTGQNTVNTWIKE